MNNFFYRISSPFGMKYSLATSINIFIFDGLLKQLYEIVWFLMNLENQERHDSLGFDQISDEILNF